MTRVGSCEPADALGQLRDFPAIRIENGGKLRWAVTGSNRRPSRCKGERPPQICRFLAKQARHCAIMCGFRSRSVAPPGSSRTTRRLRKTPKESA